MDEGKPARNSLEADVVTLASGECALAGRAQGAALLQYRMAVSRSDGAIARPADAGEEAQQQYLQSHADKTIQTILLLVGEAQVLDRSMEVATDQPPGRWQHPTAAATASAAAAAALPVLH